MILVRRSMIALLAVLALGACARPRTGGDAASAGAAFLARNAKAPGIHVTQSGLQRSGPAAGLRPKGADEVKVNYEGKLLDGEVFDSSFERGVPSVMTLHGLIPAWVEVLQMMRPGDEWLIYAPPALGYGDKGAGPIPPSSVLVFRIDLIGVLPDSSSIGQG